MPNDKSTAKPTEIVTGRVVGDATPTRVVVPPTQVRRPWQATVRTVLQLAIALATLLPFIAAGIYDTEADYPAVVVQVLVVAGWITKVMALPQVEVFLQRYAPWLSAAGRR